MNNVQFFLLAAMISFSPALNDKHRVVFGILYLILAVFFLATKL